MSLSVTTVGSGSALPAGGDPAAAPPAPSGAAIMAEMLSGDMGVAAVLGMLRNDVALIDKLLATFPKNLGQNLDVAG